MTARCGMTVEDENARPRRAPCVLEPRHDGDHLTEHDRAGRIGRVFALRLRAAIGSRPFDLMVRRNRAEPNPNVCHSHDFTDANVIMADAYREVMGYAPYDDPDRAPTQADTDLWNDAWIRAHLR